MKLKINYKNNMLINLIRRIALSKMEFLSINSLFINHYNNNRSIEELEIILKKCPIKFTKNVNIPNINDIDNVQDLESYSYKYELKINNKSDKNMNIYLKHLNTNVTFLDPNFLILILKPYEKIDIFGYITKSYMNNDCGFKIDFKNNILEITSNIIHDDIIYNNIMYHLNLYFDMINDKLFNIE